MFVFTGQMRLLQVLSLFAQSEVSIKNMVTSH